MRSLAYFIVAVALAGCSTSGDPGTVPGSATSTVPDSVAEASTTTSTTAAVTSTTEAEPTTTAPSSTTTATAPTTTAAPTTTTIAATTTTSGGPYEVGSPELYPLSPLPGSDGAGGSGCAPGAGPLPDGVWFGYVGVIGADSVDFDLACFYFGDIAYTEGAEDGEEVNNDYYVRNVNPALRTVPVASGATVYEIEATSVGFLTVPFADWPVDPTGYIACPADWCGVWLFVNGGVATEILEQYVP